MTTARSWLPEGALTDPGAAGAIAGTIGDWMKNWFAGATLSIPAQWQRLPPAGELDGDWSPPRLLTPHMAMQCRHDARDVIGESLLSFPAPRSNPHAKDRQLLQSVGDSVLADLIDRLARFAAGLDGPAWSPRDGAGSCRFFLTIEDGKGSAVIRLLADPAFIIVLARRGAPKPKEALALTRRADALTGVSIECGMLLGRASLLYREVHDLAVGDVLILDTRPDTASDLLVDGKVAARRAIHLPVVGTGASLPTTRTQ